MNPFTALRQALGVLRADVEAMYQDALTQERAHQGEPAVDTEAKSRALVDCDDDNREAETARSVNQPRRRGRPPKAPQPAPVIPGATWTAQPDPDGDAFPAIPASRVLAPSRRKVGNRDATLRDFLGADSANLERSSLNAPGKGEKNFTRTPN